MNVKLTQKHIWIGIAVAIVLGIGALIVFRPKAGPLDDYVFETVQEGELIQTVDVTGTIVPVSEVALAFETSGRIAYLSGGVGSRVSAGTVLASLGSADNVSDLARAKASLESARALLQQQEAVVEAAQVKLTELQKGARPEEVSVVQTQWQIAKEKLVQLESGRTNLLMNAKIQATDAINRLTDDFFTNDQSSVPNFRFQTSSQVNVSSLESQRVEMQAILANFSETDLIKAKQQLTSIKLFLDQLTAAFNQVIGYDDGSAISATTIDTNKASLKTAIANVQNEINLLTDRENAISSQTLTIEQITKELALKEAPATAEQFAAQEAVIKQAQAAVVVQQANIAQAEASVQSVQAQLAKKGLIAPFSGVIAKREVHVGEIVSAHQEIVTIISDAAFQIEANVPEVDVGFLAVGQSATVEADAFPSLNFNAQIVRIDPAETRVEGVATYKTVLNVMGSESPLKSGMTVDVEIFVQDAHGIIIPSRAVVTHDGQTFVRVKVGDTLEERPVVVGIRAEGRIEIIEGLQVGEEIVTRESI